jgi:uncharacterized membrane protein
MTATITESVTNSRGLCCVVLCCVVLMVVVVVMVYTLVDSDLGGKQDDVDEGDENNEVRPVDRGRTH